jgi:hypothetical protein
MPHAIVSSARMGTACWLPIRFMQRCCECDRVEKCKLPEAVFGRLRLAENQLAELEARAKKQKEETDRRIAEAKEELKRRQITQEELNSGISLHG